MTYQPINRCTCLDSLEIEATWFLYTDIVILQLYIMKLNT